MQKNEHKIQKVLDGSAKNVAEIIDPNAIVGRAIKLDDGRTVIPISKVTIGYINAGGEYGEVKIFSKSKSHPFAGGGGAIINMSPNGFLVCEKTGVSFLKIADNLADSVFDKTAQFLEKTIYEKN